MIHPRPKPPPAIMAQTMAALIEAKLAEADNPNDRAFCECIAAAIGAWKMGAAQHHLEIVRAVTNGDAVFTRDQFEASTN